MIVHNKRTQIINKCKSLVSSEFSVRFVIKCIIQSLEKCTFFPFHKLLKNSAKPWGQIETSNYSIPKLLFYASPTKHYRVFWTLLTGKDRFWSLPGHSPLPLLLHPTVYFNFMYSISHLVKRRIDYAAGILTKKLYLISTLRNGYFLYI